MFGECVSAVPPWILSMALFYFCFLPLVSFYRLVSLGSQEPRVTVYCRSHISCPTSHIQDNHPPVVYGLLSKTCCKSSCLSKRNRKVPPPRSAPSALPWRFQRLIR